MFISDEDVANQLGPEFVSTLGEETRYSYGGGLRFALGQALVARIDAGFSEEESGLFYLTFGHASRPTPPGRRGARSMRAG